MIGNPLVVKKGGGDTEHVFIIIRDVDDIKSTTAPKKGEAFSTLILSTYDYYGISCTDADGNTATGDITCRQGGTVGSYRQYTISGTAPDRSILIQFQD